ncbi:hypothetical protein HanPSC8_Chr01g0018161 [Helianthus annuus]|nr:hypothetical protein HanPSC8_Chr01g0018161 [Helianthus annuus]
MFLRSINFTDTPGRDGGHMMMAVGGGGGWCLHGVRGRQLSSMCSCLTLCSAILSDR